MSNLLEIVIIQAFRLKVILSSFVTAVTICVVVCLTILTSVGISVGLDVAVLTVYFGVIATILKHESRLIKTLKGIELS